MARSVHPTSNVLLDALDDEIRGELLTQSAEAALEPGVVLYEPGDLIDRVYFPTSGVVSITMQVDEDATVEAAAVGREGFVVMQTCLGATEVGPETYRGQVPGRMIVLDRATFVDAAMQPGRLQGIVRGYIQALFAQTAIGAACNARHEVEQRCARWLLGSHDRAEGDVFDLRPEFLAMMLGAKRATVSATTDQLHRAGFIDYRRGEVTIEDREGLKSASCECYARMTIEYARLVPLN